MKLGKEITLSRGILEKADWSIIYSIFSKIYHGMEIPISDIVEARIEMEITFMLWNFRNLSLEKFNYEFRKKYR